MSDASQFVRLTGSTGYFPGLTNTGLVGRCLVDPGADDELYLSADFDRILVTHGHADHFSSAHVLRQARGARVVVPREEARLVENPEVNVRGMFSWAKPSDEMVTKLFRGEPCEVDAFADEWSDDGCETVPLVGHTLGHTGYLTADGVLFAGDALYVRDLWTRHPLPYAIDVGLVRSSLQLIERLAPEWVVPGHGEPAPGPDVAAHVRHHVARIDAIQEALLRMLAIPRTTEDAIADVCAHLGLRESPSQYWLAVTTVKAFLSELLAQGLAEFYVEGHRGFWRARG